MRHSFWIFLFAYCFSFAQKKPADTLFLMNGNIVVSPVLDTSFLAATFVDPEDSTKRQHIENENLFAIRYHTGDIFYYYKEDTIQNYFSRDEMKLYMQGERDAKKGFKAKGSFYGTMACGLVGGLSGTFFGPLLPIAYFAGVGIPKVRIKHNTVSNPANVDYDSYLLGYERVARAKRRKASLIGGGIGLVAGYVLWACLKSVYPVGLR
jgi:hypothetical protein